MLSLTLRVFQKVYIGGRPFCLTKVGPGLSARITDEEGVDYFLSDEPQVVFGEAKVGVARSMRNTAYSIAVSFDAPRDVEILRGEVYDRSFRDREVRIENG